MAENTKEPEMFKVPSSIKGLSSPKDLPAPFLIQPPGTRFLVGEVCGVLLNPLRRSAIIEGFKGSGRTFFAKLVKMFVPEAQIKVATTPEELEKFSIPDLDPVMVIADFELCDAIPELEAEVFNICGEDAGYDRPELEKFLLGFAKLIDFDLSEPPYDKMVGIVLRYLFTPDHPWFSEDTGQVYLPLGLVTKAFLDVPANFAGLEMVNCCPSEEAFQMMVEEAFLHVILDVADRYDRLTPPTLEGYLEHLGAGDDPFDDFDDSDKREQSTRRRRHRPRPQKLANPLETQEKLKESIIGQDKVIQKITDAFIPLQVFPTASKRPAPLQSFMFLGPTGVGKTETATLLAKNLFEKPVELVRIDMSEFAQDHEVAKLFGAPPGYVGYESGGILTSALKKNPQAVVVLDEIEKAHPKVWDTFLQVLDYGKLTDGKGETVDFSKSVIIFTGNIGTKELTKSRAGFVTGNEQNLDAEQVVKRVLKEEFRPEFLNRIDNILCFDKLSEDVLRNIIKLNLDIFKDSVKKDKVELLYSEPELIDFLYKQQDNELYGAREVKRAIRKQLVTPLGNFILSKTKPGQTSKKIRVRANGDNLSFEVEKTSRSRKR